MLKRILIIALTLISTLSLVTCQTSPGSSPNITPVTVKPTVQISSPNATASNNISCFPISPEGQVPISFTPDGNMLVINTRSSVQLFNLETMEEETSIVSTKPIVAVALSPDGQLLAWSLEDHSLQIVRVSDGKVLETLNGHMDVVFKLRFSFRGDRLFSGSYDSTVRIWSREGDLIKVIQTDDDVLGMAVSADGTRLATIPFDGPVQLWDLTDYQKLSASGGTGGFSTSDAVFSPDGKYLAADLATGLYLWRLSDGKSLWDDLKNSMAITFSPDGKYLAYSIVDNENKVFLGTPDGSQIIRTLEGMQGSVWDLFFSQDSSRIAAIDSQEIRIWQVDSGQLLYLGKTTCP